MKKGSLILAVLVLITFYSAKAQQVTVGGGLAFGTEISEPGIGLNGQYFFNKSWAVAPSLIFYFADKTTTYAGGNSIVSKTSVWEFNADANYYFYDKGIKLYAIGGLNFTGIKGTETRTAGNSNVYFQDYSSSTTKAGINLGVGIDFKTSGKITPFLLTKYTASDYNQLVLFGGIRYILN